MYWTSAWESQIQRSIWIVFHQTTKWERLMKAKSRKVTVSLHELFLKNCNWSLQGVSMFGKDRLVCIWSCMGGERGHETIRLQLTGVVLSMAGNVLGSGTVQRKFKFSVVQRHVWDQILHGHWAPFFLLKLRLFHLSSLLYVIVSLLLPGEAGARTALPSQMRRVSSGHPQQRPQVTQPSHETQVCRLWSLGSSPLHCVFSRYNFLILFSIIKKYMGMTGPFEGLWSNYAMTWNSAQEAALSPLLARVCLTHASWVPSGAFRSAAQGKSVELSQKPCLVPLLCLWGGI